MAITLKMQCTYSVTAVVPTKTLDELRALAEASKQVLAAGEPIDSKDAQYAKGLIAAAEAGDEALAQFCLRFAMRTKHAVDIGDMTNVSPLTVRFLERTPKQDGAVDMGSLERRFMETV